LIRVGHEQIGPFFTLRGQSYEILVQQRRQQRCRRSLPGARPVCARMDNGPYGDRAEGSDLNPTLFTVMIE
jgi:hypothetical protein